MLVIFMLYKCLLIPVPSDNLESSSVMNSVVDKLFVEGVCACFLTWC